MWGANARVVTGEEITLIPIVNKTLTKNPIRMSRGYISAADAAVLQRALRARRNGQAFGDFWQFRDGLRWESKDKAYWKGVFSTVRRTVWVIPDPQQPITHVGPRADKPVYPNTESLIAIVKRWRHEHRISLMIRSDEDRYGKRVFGWMCERIKKELGHELCVDNYRFARADKPNERRRYFRAKASGCCGSLDFEARCPFDGKRYLLGCNYGH